MDDLDALIVASVGDVADPYPEFAERRRLEPVRREEGLAGEDVITVFRYADGERVLRDARTFSSRVYEPFVGVVFGPSIVQMDGTEHHRHRGIIGGAFRRMAVEKLIPNLLEPTVHGLIDAFAARGRAELVRALTIRYPIKIIAELLGLPSEDDEAFTRQTIRLIGFPNDVQGGLDAARELGAYFSGIVAERRRSPGADLISTLASAEIDGAPLSDEHVYGFLRLLLPAGAETTYRLLGILLLALLSDREQLEAVRADRSLIPRAIEEALRWEPPVQFVSRETTREVEIAGVPIPKGTHVSVSLGSVNHDEAVFDRPERFDLWAERAPHLAFAEGPHRCVGEHLARAEVTVAINAVLDRLGDLRLDLDAREPQMRGVAFRSPDALPVVFSAA